MGLHYAILFLSRVFFLPFSPILSRILFWSLGFVIFQLCFPIFITNSSWVCSGIFVYLLSFDVLGFRGFVFLKLELYWWWICWRFEFCWDGFLYLGLGKHGTLRILCFYNDISTIYGFCKKEMFGCSVDSHLCFFSNLLEGPRGRGTDSESTSWPNYWGCQHRDGEQLCLWYETNIFFFIIIFFFSSSYFSFICLKPFCFLTVNVGLEGSLAWSIWSCQL